MQMKNKKRFLALAAAAAMVIAPCSAFATSPSPTTTSSAISGIGTSGTGTNEGWVDESYFSVTYPTTVDGELDFVLDPQQLINRNQGATADTNHAKANFEANETLFFNNGSGNWNHYSKDYVLEAKSSTPVDVSVSATVSCSSIQVTTDSAIKASTDTSVSVYIALTTGAAATNEMNTGNGTVPADPSTKNATMTAELAALPETSFQITTVGGKYKYDLADPTSTTGSKLTFHLEGAANPHADWSKYVDIQPTIDLVWSVSPNTGTPVIKDATQKLAWNDRTQPYTFKVDLASFDANAVTDIGVMYKGTVFDYTGSWKGFSNLQVYNYAKVEGNTITLNPDLSDYVAAGATGSTDGLFIKFDDDANHWILLQME